MGAEGPGGGRLPTFLGIGAPKAGTTWLCRILESHPDVAMSAHRKEVHYFDLHHERGLGWYERFFPADATGAVAVGEFTPHYLYDLAALDRIRAVPSIQRLLLVIRNPVDPAFSHYRFRLRQDARRWTFEEFLDEHPEAIAWGRYGMHLGHWLEAFGPDRLCVLVFEHAVVDPLGVQARLAAHLGLDASGWPAEPPPRTNESFVPRRGRLYGAAVRRARWLRQHDLDPLISAARRVGIGDLLKRADPSGDVPPMDREHRRRLWDEFEPDVVLLERLLGADLSIWREAVEAA